MPTNDEISPEWEEIKKSKSPKSKKSKTKKDNPFKELTTSKNKTKKKTYNNV